MKLIPIIFLKKFFNTFCYPKYKYKKIDLKSIQNQKETRNFLRLFFFLKNTRDETSWANGDYGKFRDPNHFLQFREGLDDFFLNYLIEKINKNDSILDLGCNSGRHLNFLYKNGFKNLNGVDIMEASFKNFKKNFPDTYNATTLNLESFQNFLPTLKNNTYECVYTVGATIELIHPTFDIIGEICRVAKKQVFLLIFPDKHTYPRFYSYELRKNNFRLVNKFKLKSDAVLFHYQSK